MSTNSSKNSSNVSGFSALMEKIAIPEKNTSGNGNNHSLYKKEIYAKLSALDETGAKRLRKQLRNERNAYVLDGLQIAKNLGENAFKDWVKKTWMPFAERTYQNVDVFFEKTKASNPEKIQLLENFAKLIQICK